MFPNNSISGVALVALVSFLIGFTGTSKKRGHAILFYTVFLAGIFCLLLLKSRSGLIGLVAGSLALRYKWKHFKAAGLLVFLLLFITALFFYKFKSTEGRLLIYKISLKIFSDNWVKGIGAGKLKATYNEYQADYFITHDINGREALLADNSFYAFNDYLQWGIETGCAGIIVLALFIFLLYKRVNNIFKEKGRVRVVVAAASGLIAIASACLFSYPMQVWPVQLLAIIFTGIILFYQLGTKKSTIFRISLYAFRLLFVGLCCFFLTGVYNHFARTKLEEEAFVLSRAGYKTKAMEVYRELVRQWPAHGHNTLLLAEHLYYTNQLQEALQAIEKSRLYYVENKTYLLEAKIYTELENYTSAEKSCLRAIYMVPNRMASRFDLMSFYAQRKDTLNSVKWANAVLAMPVKVTSGRTNLMQQQAQQLLRAFNGSD